MRKVACLAAMLLLSACEDIIDATAPCVGAFPPDLSGRWTLHGEGQRSGCADERLNGAVTFSTATPLPVVQTYNGQFSSLTLDPPVDGLSFEGGLVDHCSVSFRMVEDSAEGPIRYELRGDPDGLNGPHIERGQLTAEGPGTCRVMGTFSVSIAP